MSCWETFLDYGLRSIGIGENLLPKTDFTVCQHVVLIGSGLIWNIYFGALALFFGFFLANVVALAKASSTRWIRKPAEWFIFVFRGSPLFIQFFLFYETFVLLPRTGIEIPLGFTTITLATSWLTKAWAGALIVLFLNTAAYTGEIFYGALRSVPKGDIEAADAYGMHGWKNLNALAEQCQHIAFGQWLENQERMLNGGYDRKIRPDGVVENMRFQSLDGLGQGMHPHRLLTAGCHRIQHQGQGRNMIEMGVCDQHIVNLGHVSQAQIAHTGASIDQKPVIDQKRRGFTALCNGTRATQYSNFHG